MLLKGLHVPCLTLGVEFLSNSTTVGESDGVAAFTLISSFPPDEPFTVQVTSGETDPVSARSKHSRYFNEHSIFTSSNQTLQF